MEGLIQYFLASGKKNYHRIQRHFHSGRQLKQLFYSLRQGGTKSNAFFGLAGKYFFIRTNTVP
jgi:hypothetical protein